MLCQKNLEVISEETEGVTVSTEEPERKKRKLEWGKGSALVQRDAITLMVLPKLQHAIPPLRALQYENEYS